MHQRTTAMINSELTLLFWCIGRRIHTEVLAGARAGYGQEIVPTLAAHLVRDYGHSFAEKNLRRMVQFAAIFSDEPIVVTLSRQLSWSHFVALLPLKDPLQREYYAQVCCAERWSVRTLRGRIDSMLYERTALSRQPTPCTSLSSPSRATTKLDSLIALGILNRVKKPGWRVSITSPTARVRSMNCVVLEAQASLRELAAADAVIVGSGLQTREVVADKGLMTQLQLDPSRQLLGAQCSGTLILAKLGLLDGVPACTDLTTKPWVQEAGIEVLNQPLFVEGNIATAGGCLASHYLAAWMIARLECVEAAQSALHYVAPVGEKEDYVSRAMRHISPYLQDASSLSRTSKDHVAYRR